MKISAIKTYNFHTLNNTVNKSVQNPCENTGMKDLYPFGYTNNVSFGAYQYSNVNRLNYIGEENFPNEYILNRTKEALANNETTTIYEIHQNYYGDLLNCKTLEEAKEKYPEFKDVVDAKDFPQQEYGVIAAVQYGEIDGVDIENLTLTLLKMHFVGLKNTGAYQHCWGHQDRAMTTLFKQLNITPLSKSYTSFVSKQNPNSFSHLRNRSKTSKQNIPTCEDKIARKIAQINEDDFPNKDILNAYKQVLLSGEDKKLSQIHDEYYADLLSCETLEEAKERYPEFKDVIDAKDVKERHYLSILNSIERGEREGVSLDDVSLKLLQAHYAKRISMFDKDKVYGISSGGLRSLYKQLNIPQIKYLQAMSLENSAILNYDMSEIIAEYRNSAEKKAKLSEAITKGWERKRSGKKPSVDKILHVARPKINNLCMYSETLATAMKVNKELRLQFSEMIQKSKDLKVITYKLDLNQPLIDEDKDAINKFFDELKVKKEMQIYSWTLEQMRKELLTNFGFEVEAQTDEN